MNISKAKARYASAGAAKIATKWSCSWVISTVSSTPAKCWWRQVSRCGDCRHTSARGMMSWAVAAVYPLH